MAINTAAKRRAVAGSRSVRTYQTPNNTTSAVERAYVLGFFATPAAVPGLAVGTFRHTEYLYLIEDIVSRRVLGDLQLTGVVYEDFLNRPGSLRGSLALSDPSATTEVIDPGARAIYVQRNGVIEWGGLLVSAPVAPGSETIAIGCIGWPGWFDRRDIWTDYVPVDVDQFEIFQHLVVDAQDELGLGAGADLGITVTWDALSGVLRTRQEDYLQHKAKNLGEALRQLAGLIDGFDFGMQYTIANDQIVKTVKLFYPTKGRDTGFVFEYQRGAATNILARGLDNDSSNMAWRMMGWGSGADETKLRSPQVTEARRGVYPFYDGQAQFQGDIEQTTLDDNTAAVLARTDHVSRIPRITVDPDRDPRWGTYGTGDTVRVVIDDGYASFPIDGTDGTVRIVGMSMNADADQPTLTVVAA